ncbi:Hypothetical predicted protein, partial [Marmota monax]
ETWSPSAASPARVSYPTTRTMWLVTSRSQDKLLDCSPPEHLRGQLGSPGGSGVEGQGQISLPISSPKRRTWRIVPVAAPQCSSQEPQTQTSLPQAEGQLLPLHRALAFLPPLFGQVTFFD